MSLPPCAEDLTQFRSCNAVSIKVWLPEPLDERLKSLVEYQLENRSELIRNALFQHVYGAYCFEQMRSQQEGLFWTRPLIETAAFSRSPKPSYNLGKNIVNVRVWLPAKLRDDLALLAANANKTWSHYVREVLIFHFMGCRLLIATQSVLDEARQHAADNTADDDDDA